MQMHGVVAALGTTSRVDIAQHNVGGTNRPRFYNASQFESIHLT